MAVTSNVYLLPSALRPYRTVAEVDLYQVCESTRELISYQTFLKLEHIDPKSSITKFCWKFDTMNDIIVTSKNASWFGYKSFIKKSYRNLLDRNNVPYQRVNADPTDTTSKEYNLVLVKDDFKKSLKLLRTEKGLSFETILARIEMVKLKYTMYEAIYKKSQMLKRTINSAVKIDQWLTDLKDVRYAIEDKIDKLISEVRDIKYASETRLTLVSNEMEAVKVMVKENALQMTTIMGEVRDAIAKQQNNDTSEETSMTIYTSHIQPDLSPDELKIYNRPSVLMLYQGTLKRPSLDEPDVSCSTPKISKIESFIGLYRIKTPSLVVQLLRKTLRIKDINSVVPLDKIVAGWYCMRRQLKNYNETRLVDYVGKEGFTRLAKLNNDSNLSDALSPLKEKLCEKIKCKYSWFVKNNTLLMLDQERVADGDSTEPILIDDVNVDIWVKDLFEEVVLPVIM